MKGLRYRIKQWLENDGTVPGREETAVRKLRADEHDLNSKNITFRVFPGKGGMAVEIIRYDHQRDRPDNSLYIITEAEDLAEALAKIITMEALLLR